MSANLSSSIFRLGGNPSVIGLSASVGERCEDTTTGIVYVKSGTGDLNWIAGTSAYGGGGGGVSDGDKGDVVVSGAGTVWTIDAGVVTTTKMGGDVTTAGKALMDDADAPAQRTTLGLGTLATQSGTFSGTHSGTSSGTNTGDQTFTAATIVAAYGLPYAEVTVMDAAIGATSKVDVKWGMFTDTDENTPDMDSVEFHAVSSAGAMTVRVSAVDPQSLVGGSYKIMYFVGA